MGGHIHVSGLDFLITMAYVVVGMFLLRLLSIKYSQTSFGKALAVVIN